MAYITDEELKARVASALHLAPDGLPADVWDTPIADANESAYQEIVGRLVARGFTKAQVDEWDRRAEFNRVIGLYRALIFGAGLQSPDDRWPEKLKYWIDQLSEVDILIDGELEYPEDGSRIIGRGKMSTADDLFQFDPDDPRRGQVTQW